MSDTNDKKPIHGTTVEEFMRKWRLEHPEQFNADGEFLSSEDLCYAGEIFKKIRISEGCPKRWATFYPYPEKLGVNFFLFLPEWQNAHPELCCDKRWYKNNLTKIREDWNVYSRPFFEAYTQIQGGKLEESSSHAHDAMENKTLGPHIAQEGQPIRATTIEEFILSIEHKYSKNGHSGGRLYLDPHDREIEGKAFQEIRMAEGAPVEAACMTLSLYCYEEVESFTRYVIEWQNSHPKQCTTLDWYKKNKLRIKIGYWYSPYNSQNREENVGCVLIILGMLLVGSLLWPIICFIFGYIGLILYMPFAFLFAMDSADPQEFGMGFFFTAMLFMMVVTFIIKLFK